MRKEPDTVNVACLEKCQVCLAEKCCRNCAYAEYGENSQTILKLICIEEERDKGKLKTQPKTVTRGQSFIMKDCQKWRHFRPNNLKAPEPVVDPRYNPFQANTA